MGSKPITRRGITRLVGQPIAKALNAAAEGGGSMFC
jgi:hypothetical protein